MADYVSKDMINKAMQVDLLEYAKSLGMEFETRGSNNTLYQKGHSLNITRSKNMYYRFSTGTGGNVINFAMEQNGWTFQQAVRALCGEEIQKSVPKQTYTPAKQIPEHKNGQAGYASVRSTYTMGNSYRGDVKNSDKRHCFTLNGKSDSVYVFEAPIDAMSHATLTKVSGWDWQEDWRIALGGVSDLGLQQFLSLHPEIKNIHFATDNDEQGKKVLENEYNTDGTIKKVGYMQKYKDKGYEVFREEPAHKDFNEDLCAFMEEQTPIQEDMSL